MLITDVSITIFRWEDVTPVRYHGQTSSLPKSDLGLLRVTTEDGSEGQAFLGSSMNPASMDAHMLMRWLKPILIGQNALDRELLHERMHRVRRLVPIRTIGAVDVALWDLAGKISGLPVHALLGSYRKSIPAYASSQIFSEINEYVEQALHLQDLGWKAYKIHPPQQPQIDIKVCEAVRNAVGDEYKLMLDSTWSYNYPDALRVGRALERLNYYWYEDPLADNDIYNYVKLREKLDIPIMATEYPAGGLEMYAIWLTERATDYLRGDVPNKGGISTMVKTAHLAEAFGLGYEIHHSGNSLGNLANLHVAVSLNNCEMFEVLQPDGAHKYGLAEELEIDAEGLIQAPQAPGLGAKIDYELIDRQTVEVLH